MAGDPKANGDNYCYSRGRKLSEFPNPAGTLQVVEMHSTVNVIAQANHSAVLRPASKGTSAPGCSGPTQGNSNCGQDYAGDAFIFGEPAHFQGWNYLFADGHVKWLKPEATVGTSAGGTVTSPKGYWTIAAGDGD
jgi:prepilin-type processing-associated H-X9-DG protein